MSILFKMEFAAKLKEKFPQESVKGILEKAKSLKVLIIGDTIIDEYIFTYPKGRAIKDPILSLDYLRSEKYAGGVQAIANHIAGFADNITLVTLLGDWNTCEGFLRKNTDSKIKNVFFVKPDSPTTIKQRFIDNVRNGKLFKVEYINDKPIPLQLEEDILKFLESEIPKYDIVVVGDFGHGFINDKIARIIEDKAKFLATNVQTNSSNMGFNYITKYSRSDYMTSNEQELRLAMSNRFGSFDSLIESLKSNTNFSNVLLTMGSSGCMLITKKGVFSAPSLTDKIKDVVGAGDAVFAITSLMSRLDADPEIITFIANCVGAIAVNIMGNKESVTKDALISFIEELR